MSRWSSIPEPTAAANESEYYKNKWNLEKDTLVKKYNDLKNKKISRQRLIYKVILLPDKNVFFVLAGSLASLPINVLTGNSQNTWLFCIRLILSLTFYYCFLRMAICANRVREEGAQYYDPVASVDLLIKAKRNVEFAACTHYFKFIERWFITSFFLLGLTLISILLPDRISQLRMDCVSFFRLLECSITPK